MAHTNFHTNPCLLCVLLLCAGGHWRAIRVAKRVSDLSNQHNNGPHQDQIFDNLTALFSALGEQKSDSSPGETCTRQALYEESRSFRFFVCFVFCFSLLSIFLCLRSPWDKYQVSTISDMLFRFYFFWEGGGGGGFVCLCVCARARMYVCLCVHATLCVCVCVYLFISFYTTT